MTEPELEKKLILVLEGKKQLAELLGLDATQMRLLAELAFLFFEEGRYDEARLIFEGLLALDLNNDYYSRALGAVHHRLGNYEMAVRYYLRAIKIDENAPEAQASLGEAYLMQGDRDRALAQLEKAEKLFRTIRPWSGQRQRVQALLKLFRRTVS
mgnify:CR=1 FL=1